MYGVQSIKNPNNLHLDIQLEKWKWKWKEKCCPEAACKYAQLNSFFYHPLEIKQSYHWNSVLATSNRHENCPAGCESHTCHLPFLNTTCGGAQALMSFLPPPKTKPNSNLSHSKLNPTSCDSVMQKRWWGALSREMLPGHWLPSTATLMYVCSL
jgi:hypothetical protein